MNFPQCLCVSVASIVVTQRYEATRLHTSSRTQPRQYARADRWRCAHRAACNRRSHRSPAILSRISGRLHFLDRNHARQSRAALIAASYRRRLGRSHQASARSIDAHAAADADPFYSDHLWTETDLPMDQCGGDERDSGAATESALPESIVLHDSRRHLLRILVTVGAARELVVAGTGSHGVKSDSQAFANHQRPGTGAFDHLDHLRVDRLGDVA